MKKLYFCLLTLIFCVPAAAEKSDSLRISLLTAAPGGQAYELFGHTGIRVRDRHNDIVFHYGVFDFNAPHFFYRFTKGETDYSIGLPHTGTSYTVMYCAAARSTSKNSRSRQPRPADCSMPCS